MIKAIALCIMPSCNAVPLHDRRNHVPQGRKDFVKLDYSVADASGHSSNYHAGHILEDHPSDQSSRWSSLTNDQNQFLLLKLERPALVRTVTFGKFFKTHVCNLKEFRVLAGSTVDNLFEVIHSGLRNDSEQETFPLNFKEENMQYSPIQWIKIIPMAAWGNNFNFSVWYVELRGIAELSLVKAANRLFHERQRQAAWRLCLKFLKTEPSMAKLLPSIEAACGFSHEAPIVQALYQLAVVRGDFSGAEALLKDASSSENLFDEYIQRNVQYQCNWERLDRGSGSSDVNPLGAPGKRGGHQMCWDPVSRRVYLFGGWDGNQDLADFWMYDVGSASWSCLSQDTRLENGPGPRSCHKICINAERRALYVFGRFVEQDSRTGLGGGNAASLDSEFYHYDLEAHVWTLLSNDVHREGGPRLLYDHQMAVDEARGLIYVFGGRIISGNVVGTEGEAEYSGLYVYHIDGNKWTCLRADSNERQPEKTPVLPARIGHSMILDPVGNLLYIFAGQRNKDYLADFYIYDISTDTVIEVEKDTSRTGGPDPGFTQRSTVDLERAEIYLFTGLLREKDKPSSSSSGTSAVSATGSSETGMSKNTFWVYSLTSRTWTRLGEQDQRAWPCPRFAHQLVYDPVERTHYLFGGNPGEQGAPKRRLNDFWRLKLDRVSGPQDLLRRACFLLRRQHYYELCLKGRSGEGQMEALHFLQNQVSAVVKHEDPVESEEFRSLSSWLFQSTTASTDANPNQTFLSPAVRSPIVGPGSYLAEPADQVALSRQQLFDDLAALLPKALRPPTASLLELVHDV